MRSSELAGQRDEDLGIAAQANARPTIGVSGILRGADRRFQHPRGHRASRAQPTHRIQIMSATSSESPLQAAMRRLRSNPLAVNGFIFYLLVVIDFGVNKPPTPIYDLSGGVVRVFSPPFPQ